MSSFTIPLPRLTIAISLLCIAAHFSDWQSVQDVVRDLDSVILGEVQ